MIRLCVSGALVDRKDGDLIYLNLVGGHEEVLRVQDYDAIVSLLRDSMLQPHQVRRILKHIRRECDERMVNLRVSVVRD